MGDEDVEFFKIIMFVGVKVKGVLIGMEERVVVFKWGIEGGV